MASRKEVEQISEEEKGTVEIQGYETVEDSVRPIGGGAHVTVPKAWLDERVKIVRVTKLEDGE